ncbi:MAG: L-histidine N(alpha)-methyltransferase [Pseudomonadota bacterium]
MAAIQKSISPKGRASDGTHAESWEAEFESDIIDGLQDPFKRISCRWLYNQRGSELFEAITLLPEYYPTRTETTILRNCAAELSTFIGENAAIVEYGAGAAVKTELLLSAAKNPSLYIAIDIAKDFLTDALRRLDARFPQLRKICIGADFTRDFPLPEAYPHIRRVAFFPGSTLGNLPTSDAKAFLSRVRNHVGSDGAAIIGVDLIKPLDILLPAYDDAAGVTAAFNLNLLERINSELAGNFDLRAFKHEARWNVAESAVEMHLVSAKDQVAEIAGEKIVFAEGESIHTESSRKYSPERFEIIARASGWKVSRFWTDGKGWFGVFGLRAI